MKTDPSSLSNLTEITTTHLHLNWDISFDKKIIQGYVVLDLKTLVDNVSKVVLDTSYLDIHNVEYNNSLIQFSLAERRKALGSALTINLPDVLRANTAFQLKIMYATTEKCTAVQYLTPEQTLGKNHPYLFSQCQAIHARAFIPCQDSPSIKLTYSANVTSPLRVIMSALERGVSHGDRPGVSTYSFHQPTTMPTYLIAIASGNLESREISHRSKVWCEPEMIEAAAKEFEDTEKFLAAGEQLLTPYDWSRYDLLILPPSFPYGGMENPCLTFVTPTLVAGDKSGVHTVIHEISHSWMGNLVTTKDWTHFWLNEGHTKFIERKIVGRLYGEQEAQLSCIIGWKALKESVELFGKDSLATVLQPDLSNGVDPDDYFSSIPYEKGFNMLYHVETVVGGPKIFEPFVKSYVQHFASKSITTDDWKNYLYEYMRRVHGQEMVNKLDSIDFDAWIHSPGMPPIQHPETLFDTTLADACYSLASRWNASRDKTDFSDFSSKDIESFTTAQKSVFLERLSDQPSFPDHLLKAMDGFYHLTDVRNSEIRFRWQLVCLKGNYKPIYRHVVSFVTEQGRMKYVRPLYRQLSLATDGGAELARSTFLENKDFYHPIASQLIAKDLGLY
ncbi:peptidase family M1-domain-containing protein [Halteromyces radiatus]|uniref:peptidase family M1-domain-containing protein n=1 Tax=Halteromyces radiatus TaxID=101107 RepID=UPI00221FE684|nr:peptidase family M1-domain-containing protein [Halteromyces radiatus]KAI8099339.1 peptidase family M1-domain-containing protein [Halteromyces radiatus]